MGAFAKEGEGDIERELADVTFEELQRARSDGSEMVYRKPNTEQKASRANKPMEISSKKPVRRLREVIQVPKKVMDAQVPQESMDDVSDALDTSLNTMKEQKLERIIIPFAVDSAQQEALFALKNLQIIEDDVKADELCTRRRYARWLIRSNSQLQRNRKHRINTSAALSGSRINAFDDVGIDDPDFESIQSLAEAGVVKSKLSDRNGGFGRDDYFLPQIRFKVSDTRRWPSQAIKEQRRQGRVWRLGLSPVLFGA
ncbi:hypothetical protein CASFOL_017574 [Castilleja foliolosa]|uniref:Uncharacterized protein n=1 Tax=Castilleja foliolosa TaxID=1961234 RepID=A0ABD3D7B6_9LAMI